MIKDKQVSLNSFSGENTRGYCLSRYKPENYSPVWFKITNLILGIFCVHSWEIKLPANVEVCFFDIGITLFYESCVLLHSWNLNLVVNEGNCFLDRAYWNYTISW